MSNDSVWTSYMRFWILAMQAICGWPPERTEEWANRTWDFARRSGILDHRLPSSYIALEIWNHFELGPAHEPVPASFMHDILFALERADPEVSWCGERFDFQAARERVLDLIKRYRKRGVAGQ